MDRAKLDAGKIKVPAKVIAGLENVRRSGRTNMLDRNAVAQIAMELGEYETAEWMVENPGDYARGLFRGMAPIDEPELKKPIGPRVQSEGGSIGIIVTYDDLGQRDGTPYLVKWDGGSDGGDGEPNRTVATWHSADELTLVPDFKEGDKVQATAALSSVETGTIGEVEEVDEQDVVFPYYVRWPMMGPEWVTAEDIEPVGGKQ